MKKQILIKIIRLIFFTITLSFVSPSSWAATKDEQHAEIFNFYWAQSERCLNDFRISIPLGKDREHFDERYTDIARELVSTKLDLAAFEENIYHSEYRPRDATTNEFMGWEYVLTFKLKLPPGLPLEKWPLSPKNKDFPAFHDQYLVFRKLIDLQTAASFEEKKHPHWQPNFWLGCQKELSGITGSNNK